MTTNPPQQKRVKREISAGFVVYRKTSQGIKYLLLYHGRNYWNFPKGHIESEEKSLTAAVRETQEEAGLGNRDLVIARNFKAHERFYFRKANQTVFKIVIFYLAETRKREIKISEEHHGYGWFLYNEAKKILSKYRDSQKVLKQADDFIHHGRRLTQTSRRHMRTHVPTQTRQAVLQSSADGQKQFYR